ncbi:MAG: hypothetical protein WC783_04615 [Candidatus Paceibacterota bacterium]|jgi:gluconate kinase
MIYWFWGYPGIGKDHVAKNFSEVAGVLYLDGDFFLNKTEKSKLMRGTFTKSDRLKKLRRIVQHLKSIKKDIAITDSLPDSNSRKFLLNTFKKDIVFILVKSSVLKHKKQTRERKSHFFNAEMIDNYVKNNWEKIENFPHVIFRNENKTKMDMRRELLKICRKFSK